MSKLLDSLEKSKNEKSLLNIKIKNPKYKIGTINII